SDDDARDRRGSDADRARHRHRRRAALRDRGDDHRRPVAVPVPDAAPRPRGVPEVRRPRAIGGQQEADRLDEVAQAVAVAPGDAEGIGRARPDFYNPNEASARLSSSCFLKRSTSFTFPAGAAPWNAPSSDAGVAGSVPAFTAAAIRPKSMSM